MTSNWCGSGRTARLWGNAKTAFTGALLAAALLSACGGGGGSGAPTVATAPAVPTGLSIGYDVKTFKLSWAAVAAPTGGGAVTYRVTEDPDGAGPQAATQIATDLTTTSHTQQVAGLLHTRLNATYTVQACNSAGCSAQATPVTADVNRAIGYFKASNTGSSNRFGDSIAISGDGATLAVGAVGEVSSATGINGVQTNNAASNSGAVYVFTRSAGVWNQQAYVKASNASANLGFGSSVALSADGATLVVGAQGESSNATGVNGDQTNNAASNSGAVYVFTRSAGVWSQQAYVKASNTRANMFFGKSVTLSADGTTLGVGAPGESSNATGINGDQTNNAAPNAGAIYVFTRSAGVWSQQAYVKASNTDANDNFGSNVVLSADGTTLAAGVAKESSNATGINGDQTNNAALSAGAVYVFAHGAGGWSQQAYVKASTNQLGASRFGPNFGDSIALSADGATLAVGAYGEASNATGINGDQSNRTAPEAGAVYVFTRSAGVWSQQAYVKASNTQVSQRFGSSVALSADGSVLAVGAPNDASGAAGITGVPINPEPWSSGAVFVFRRSVGVWSQHAFVKASTVTKYTWFGTRVSLTTDGGTLAVGVPAEASNATGINGNQFDSSLTFAGAVYLY